MQPVSTPSGLTSGALGGSYDGEWFRERHAIGSEFGIQARCVYEEQSPYQSIAIYESETFGRVLTLDGCVMVTEVDEWVYHEMLVHVPLTSVGEPKSVLVIGGGDCGSIREVLKHPGVDRVVLCELDERVTRVCEDWFPWVSATITDPRVELIFTDGIAWIVDQHSEFDVVLVDSTDPQGPAIGLFQSDFYESVAGALTPGGALAAQTESPMWDPESFRAIYGELTSVFPSVDPYLGSVPTYPGGCWSWALASGPGDGRSHFDEDRARQIETSCRYYNADIHRSAFALPGFVRELVPGHER